MRIAVNVTTDSDGNWESAATFAREAERLGAESIWTGESWGYDAITPLAYLAAGTDGIALGTGIIQLGARTPANLAMTAMGMQSVSGGRFRLGLGTSGPQVVEGWHGVSFASPIQRTRETIEIVRLVTSGERVSYDGDIYQLPLPDGEGRALRTSAPPVHVPIYVAALGPRNLELTGELADGWIGGSFIPETAEAFLKHIRAGAERAGRSLADLDLQIPLSVEITDNVEEAGKRHARGYGFTFGAMGSLRNNFYKNAFARQDFADEVNEVQRLWMAGERDKARDHVPVELAMKANLVGTPAMIRERIAIYRDAGIGTLRLGIPGDGIEDKLETLGQVIDLVRQTAPE